MEAFCEKGINQPQAQFVAWGADLAMGHCDCILAVTEHTNQEPLSCTAFQQYGPCKWYAGVLERG